MLEMMQNWLSALLSNGQFTTVLVAAVCLYVAWMLLSRLLSFIALLVILILGLYYIDPPLVEKGAAWIQERLFGSKESAETASLMERAREIFKDQDSR
ncbi:MAG: hypothetical protein K0S07_1678 [Chlamydiales bacterium]|jgi:hypothetical protein|nr:hypothetical protein [Chlamydiales bacterium]